jgi:hypothetical protein
LTIQIEEATLWQLFLHLLVNLLFKFMKKQERYRGLLLNLCVSSATRLASWLKLSTEEKSPQSSRDTCNGTAATFWSQLQEDSSISWKIMCLSILSSTSFWMRPTVCSTWDSSPKSTKSSVKVPPSSYIDPLVMTQSQNRDDLHVSMFSATFPKVVKGLAEKYLNDYVYINIGSTGKSGSVNKCIKQTLIDVRGDSKNMALFNLIKSLDGKVLGKLEDLWSNRKFSAVRREASTLFTTT